MNLKELSRHLGLSQTTVSRALNGFPEVAEETRRRIEEAAARFDYRPNAHARRLATGRSGSVGLLFPISTGVLMDPIFAEFLTGVTLSLAESETDIRIVPVTERDARAWRRIARLGSVDALIVSNPRVSDSRMAALADAGVPFVLHGRTRSASGYAHLDIDNEGAFRRATEFLISLGHKRIGLINADTKLNFAADRETGWRDALTAAGLAAPPAFEAEGLMTEENGWRATLAFMRMNPRPTALICSSIVLAAGACRALRELGIEIGREVSVMCHDDGLPAIRPETQRPALTTTHSPIRPAGVRIAEIARLLADGASPADVSEVWPVDIVLRDSTRPPPPEA
jgi:LacI family transcriptional regulator